MFKNTECSQQYLDPDGLLQQYNDAEAVTITDEYLLSGFLELSLMNIVTETCKIGPSNGIGIL